MGVNTNKRGHVLKGLSVQSSTYHHSPPWRQQLQICIQTLLLTTTLPPGASSSRSVFRLFYLPPLSPLAPAAPDLYSDSSTYHHSPPWRQQLQICIQILIGQHFQDDINPCTASGLLKIRRSERNTEKEIRKILVFTSLSTAYIIM